jgi:regulator of protease activity HflC (stomatin/prohibitin superfamily)
MLLRNFLDVLVPVLWALLIIGFIGYLAMLRRRYGWLRALRSSFSYRLLWPLSGLIGISLVSASLVFIDPREVGVVISLFADKGVRERPLKSGLHWIVPVVEQVVRYPIVMQSYTLSIHPTEGDTLGDDAIRARTADGQLVIIDVTLLFRIDADKAVSLHIKWQDRYVSDLVRPVLRSLVRSEASKFNVDEINSHKRKAFEQALNELIRTRSGGESGLDPQRILVRNITFSKDYAMSIEEKMTALQRVTEAEFKAEQVANLAKGEAEQIRIRARANADAIRVKAQAQAEAHVIHARAEATALNRIAEALQQRDNLLTYRYIDKLSPAIEAMLLPSNAPLILPMPDLAADPDSNAAPVQIPLRLPADTDPLERDSD